MTNTTLDVSRTLSGRAGIARGPLALVALLGVVALLPHRSAPFAAPLAGGSIPRPFAPHQHGVARMPGRPLLHVGAGTLAPATIAPAPVLRVTRWDGAFRDSDAQLRRVAARRTAALAQALTRHASRAVTPAVAYGVARAVERHARAARLPVALVAGVVLVENPELKASARSGPGARGIMQVMPMWKGRFRCASDDLNEIDGNICHGTYLLAALIRETRGDTTKALLRYNGCVHGTNTPNCHSYPQVVARRTKEASRAMRIVTEIGEDPTTTFR